MPRTSTSACAPAAPAGGSRCAPRCGCSTTTAPRSAPPPAPAATSTRSCCGATSCVGPASTTARPGPPAPRPRCGRGSGCGGGLASSPIEGRKPFRPPRPALMLEIYRYRDLVFALVARELKVRYRRSAIGFTWTMLQPLLMMLVLQVVFNSLFRFKLPEGTNCPVYALSGILFWNFFSQSIVASMNSLRGNSPILRKLPVPKAVFPLATVISGVINLVLALVPLLLIMAA